MIGSIRGTVLVQQHNQVIIETSSGVGYRIFIGNQPLHQNDSILLFTYHHIREDANDLYGFKDMADLHLFELLLTVSGVGPKMAQTILTTLNREAIIDGVSTNQPAIFKSVSGVGQKVAEKIILELKNKIGSINSGGSSDSSDIFDALVNLGYSQTEVANIITQIDPTFSTHEKLKHALKLLAK